MQNRKKWVGWKIAMLCLLLAIVIGIPSYMITAATKTSSRTLLKNTIAYCDKMSKTEYTSDSWKAFQKELTKSKAVYKKTKEIDKVYATARDNLERVKANLMFVPSKDKGNPLPYRNLTSKQIVEEMGAGWNLGNTMDGNFKYTPSETSWQPTVTTKALIKSVHDMGFNTIRIPVTWGTMIDDNNGFKINDAWISRVQDIVDYAISQDMYVVINIHHDGLGDQGAWLNVEADDIDSVYNKFAHVWKNIAERFKDYDEHLIFEDMNEVGYDTYQHDNMVLNNFNQVFVNMIRSTGSNNSQRWLSVPPRQTGIEMAVNSFYGFKVPTDTVKNRLFISMHSYDMSFGISENTSSYKCTYNMVGPLVKSFKQITDTFTSKGIPVILGEYGAINKNNTNYRQYYYESISRICQLNGIVACAWDQGWYDLTKKPDFSFSLIDRPTGTKVYPDIINGIMRGTYLPAKTTDVTDVVMSPTIVPATDITLSQSAVSMTIGDATKITATVAPAESNDIILWKTEDPTIATVSSGHIRARGIGTTTLTAFSQNGTLQKTVAVTVKAMTSIKPCTSITTDKDTYSINKGKYVNIIVTLTPTDTDDFVTYKSSDESVATVSTLGKIVGCKQGSATITITSSNGMTKTVQVSVQ